MLGTHWSSFAAVAVLRSISRGRRPSCEGAVGSVSFHAGCVEKLLVAQSRSPGSLFSVLSGQPLLLPLAQPLALAQQNGPGGSEGPELAHLVALLGKRRRAPTF